MSEMFTLSISSLQAKNHMVW